MEQKVWAHMPSGRPLGNNVVVHNCLVGKAACGQLIVLVNVLLLCVVLESSDHEIKLF